MFDQKTYMKEYYQRNKATLDSKVKKWKAKHPEKDKEYAKTFRDKNKDDLNAKARERRIEDGDEINKKTHDYREATVRSFLSKKLSNLKGKHHGRQAEKYKCSLTLDYLVDLWGKQDGFCAISHKKMDYKFNSPFGVSVDRIDSNLSYCEGNVQLVCQAINFAKNCFSNEEFLYFWENDKSKV